MNFNWKDYLDFAKSLKCFDNKTIDEAACRASISRAYYAVYGLSCNYLCYIEKDQHLEWAIKKKNPQTINDILDEHKSFHSYVYKQFAESNYVLDDEQSIKTKLVIADAIDFLKRRRKKADYDDRIHNIKKETQASLTTADEIIKNLQYLKDNIAKI